MYPGKKELWKVTPERSVSSVFIPPWAVCYAGGQASPLYYSYSLRSSREPLCFTFSLYICFNFSIYSSFLFLHLFSPFLFRAFSHKGFLPYLAGFQFDHGALWEMVFYAEEVFIRPCSTLSCFLSCMEFFGSGRGKIRLNYDTLPVMT
jgi:hypothetical protein